MTTRGVLTKGRGLNRQPLPLEPIPAQDWLALINLQNLTSTTYLSAPLKTPHPFFQQPNAARAAAEQIERCIEASGLEWTFLRPGMFASNAPHWWGQQLRSGDLIRWPYLDVPTAPIDPRDIAAIGVRALCEDGHSGAEYVLTGPESLTQREQISIVGTVLGRPLRIEEMTPDEARKELATVMDWGALPPPAISAVIEKLLSAWGAAVGLPAFVSTTFAEITGTQPRTFRRWASDNLECLAVGGAAG